MLRGYICFSEILINIIKMSALFSVVARGTSVLAKHATCVGNFTEILEQILPKIAPTPVDNKYTYSHEKYVYRVNFCLRFIFLIICSYLFNVIIGDGITYLCITDMVRYFLKLYVT